MSTDQDPFERLREAWTAWRRHCASSVMDTRERELDCAAEAVLALPREKPVDGNMLGKLLRSVRFAVSADRAQGYMNSHLERALNDFEEGSKLLASAPPAPEPAMPREDVEVPEPQMRDVDAATIEGQRKIIASLTNNRDDWKAKCEKAEAAHAQARADLDNLEQSDAAVFQTTIRTLARLLTEAERKP